MTHYAGEVIDGPWKGRYYIHDRPTFRVEVVGNKSPVIGPSEAVSQEFAELVPNDLVVDTVYYSFDEDSLSWSCGRD